MPSFRKNWTPNKHNIKFVIMCTEWHLVLQNLVTVTCSEEQGIQLLTIVWNQRQNVICVNMQNLVCSCINTHTRHVYGEMRSLRHVYHFSCANTSGRTVWLRWLQMVGQGRGAAASDGKLASFKIWKWLFLLTRSTFWASIVLDMRI